MKKLDKFVIILAIILLPQVLLSQSRCDSTKTVKLSMCDMDNITTVFRDRTKFIKLNAVNDSILKRDSIVIANYKKVVSNDSTVIKNLKINNNDKDSIIITQKSTIKSEQNKTLFYKITTYISSGVATISLILTLLK